MTNKGDKEMNDEYGYVVIEGWCAICGDSLDGLPITTDVCLACEREASE